MWNRYRKMLICFLVAAAASVLPGCRETQEDSLEELRLDGEREEDEEDAADGTGNGHFEEEPSEESVFVYVCGAVRNPGVYELEEGARVFEALELAGGVTEHAAPETVDQARVVSDGENIYVPTREEVQKSEAISGTERIENQKININTAGMEELMTLTGIGEAKANSILNYREENGRFESIEEIMDIPGIKEGVFDKIKDDITI